MKLLRYIERLLLLGGLGLLGFCTYTYVSGHVYSRMVVRNFQSSPRTVGMDADTDVDFSLWSDKRIQAYEATLAKRFEEPVAVLRINKIRLEVPVFEGTDEETLNRGAGRINGTAHPGEDGNIGVAGHRDGFFRGLKDILIGDTVQLDTKSGTQVYTIDSIKIVAPSDVSVLKRDLNPSLTLVTCFPFYFIGSAPQRYIVHASLSGNSNPVNAPAKASLKNSDSTTKENAK